MELKKIVIIILSGSFVLAHKPLFALSQDINPGREKIIDAALARAEKDLYAQAVEPHANTPSSQPSPSLKKAQRSSIPALESDSSIFAFSEKYARENAAESIPHKHLLEINSESFYYRYREPSVMRNVGTMYGAYGTYAYRPGPGDPLYTKIADLYGIEGRYSFCQVDYKSENGVIDENIDDWAAELRGIVGKEYVDAPFTISLYSGFGYRYLNDNSSGRLTIVGSTGYYGYQRESNYYYIPLGIEFSRQMTDAWALAFHIEYDMLIYGLQISHLSDGDQFISTRNDDVKNPQHEGYGVRAAIKLTKESNMIGLVFEPFIRYWNIEDSDVVTAFVDGSYGNSLEPHNQTIETGLKLGLQF